jgi:hypothetical protein
MLILSLMFLAGVIGYSIGLSVGQLEGLGDCKAQLDGMEQTAVEERKKMEETIEELRTCLKSL